MTQHGGTTQELAPRTAVGVRPYRPLDHNACRRLWAEFVEQQHALYEPDFRVVPGEVDTGAGFEEYLTRLDLSGMWVADQHGVVGFAGLVLNERGGSVDPVVVTARRRGEGIGRTLLAFVADEARRRGLRELTVSPAMRNVEAIHCLHAAGYGVLSNITLTLHLDHRPAGLRAGPELHGLRFRS